MTPPRFSENGTKPHGSSPRRNTGAAFAPAPPSATSSTIDWGGLWYSMREKWWILALCLLLAAGGAIAYLVIEPKLFTAHAALAVEEEGQQVMNVREVQPEEFRSAEQLKTVEQALSSRMLATRVIRAAKLLDDKTYGEPKPGRKYGEGDLVGILGSRCEIKLRKGSRLIDLNVDDTDPTRAKMLASTFISEFVNLNFEQRGEATGTASEFLVKESEELRAKLEKSEQALQDYREKYGAVSLEDRENIVADKLKDLNRAVTLAKGDRIKVEADYQAFKSSDGKPYTELLTIPSVANLPEVAQLQTQINAKEAEFAELKKRYLPEHPKYQAAESQLAELRRTMQLAVSKAQESLKQMLDNATENETRMVTALKEQEQSSLELSKIAIPYKVLQREMESDRTLFESVISRLKEMKVAQGAGNTNVRIVESPYVYSTWTPDKPKLWRVLVVAFLGAFVLSGAIFFLLNICDNTLTSVDQAEELLGMRCLAVLPKSKFSGADQSLVLSHRPSAVEAEGIRTLRTSLSLVINEAHPQVTLFTSAVPGEGKTFIAANYAHALADRGLRTLLIDADLRRPGLAQIFPNVPKDKGLSSCLSGFAAFHESCAATEFENLSILPAGPISPNPAELLAGDAFGQILEAAGQSFECIVIDSAPINVVSDTLLLSEHSTEVCFIVRACKTSLRKIERAMHLLKMADCKPIGFVLNLLPAGAAFKYHAHYEGEYASEGVYGTTARSGQKA